MTHYRCQRVIPKITISMMISETTQFSHHHITKPSVTPEDRVLHGLQHLTADLQGAPSSRSGDQIRALKSLQDTLNDWAGDTTPQVPTAPQSSKKDKWDDRLPPRVQPPSPMVQNTSNVELPQASRVLVPLPAVPAQPVAHRTRARHEPVPLVAPPTMPPMAPPDVTKQPVDHCTRYRALEVQPSQAANCKYPIELLELWFIRTP